MMAGGLSSDFPWAGPRAYRGLTAVSGGSFTFLSDQGRARSAATPRMRRSRLTLERQWLTFRKHGFKVGMWRSLVRSGAPAALKQVAMAPALQFCPICMSRLSRT